MVWTTGHVVTAGRLGIIAITAGRRGRIDVEAIAYCRRMGFLEPERNRRSYGGGGSRVHPHDGIPRFDYIYIYLCVCARVYWSSWTVSSMGRDFRDRENILKGEGGKVARRQLW